MQMKEIRMKAGKALDLREHSLFKTEGGPAGRGGGPQFLEWF